MEIHIKSIKLILFSLLFFLFASCGDRLGDMLKPKNQGRFDTGNSTTVSYADKITDLTAGSPTKTTIYLSWSEPSNSSGTDITDYVIYYRQKQTGGIWLTFDDGTSTNTNASITGLANNKTYEFRVAATNGTESPVSNIAEQTTRPNDNTYFGTGYAAINAGGATTSTVVSYEDNTTVTLNGSPLITLGAKGDTYTFSSSRWDLIDADKPIFVSGNYNNNANVVWVPSQWAGKEFTFNSSRQNDQSIYIYAIETSVVTVAQGSTVLSTTSSITTGSNETITLSTLGSYQLSSTGLILAFQISNNDYDPKAIVPHSIDMIGFPSQSMKLSSSADSNAYTYYHADGTSGSGSLDKADSNDINGQGAVLTNYNTEAMRIVADYNIGGSSYNDGSGNASAPFFPVSYMKKKFMLNVESEFVAFASNQAGTIQVLDSGGYVIETLTLSRTGSGKSPYYVRREITVEGIRFLASVPVAVWYQPRYSAPTSTGSVANDETIMYGFD